MSECPSRETFDRYMYQNSQPVEKKKTVQPKVEDRPKYNNEEESWDHVRLIVLRLSNATLVMLFIPLPILIIAFFCNFLLI